MNIVKELRRRKGVPQKDLAQIIGVAQPTVSEWESGKKDPSGDRLKKLADYFGVDELVVLGTRFIDIGNNGLDKRVIYTPQIRTDIYNSDYEKAAIAATDVLIKYTITSTPINPLQILKSMPNVGVVSFTEIADSSGIDRKNLVTLYGSENQDAVTLARNTDGIIKYIVAYNQNMPFFIIQRALARELVHIILGHDDSRTEDINIAEALSFSRHLLCPRPLIKALLDSKIPLTIKVVGNITGCYGRFIAGIRKTPGAKVPAELNRVAKAQFAKFVYSFLDVAPLLTSDDDSSCVDFGSFMDGYEE